MSKALESILKHGYRVVQSKVTTEKRQALLKHGNDVIDLAIADDKIRSALTFNGFSGIPGKNVTGFFVDEPRVAKDDSISFHSGWQSESIAKEALGDAMPQALVDFFKVQREVLQQTVEMWSQFLDELLPEEEAADLKKLLFHENTNINNHHIRIVRYNNVINRNPDEIFSTHGDLSVLTTELAESIHRVNHIAPYPLSSVADTVDRSRYEEAITIKSKAKAISYNPESEMVTFLGFAAANVRSLRNSKAFKKLRAGFHYGKFHNGPPVVPSNYSFGKHRLAAIAFAHPHLEVPYTEYRTASTEACRPEQVFEGKTKK